jgi:uncharacterized membrane protein
MTATHRETRARKEARDLIHRNVDRIRRMEQWSKRKRNLGERIAEPVAQFCGRMSFIWLHAFFFAAWIAWNAMPDLPHFDPYPFTFLTLCVSLEAIFLSAFILISQNQEMRLTERRNLLELQLELLCEQENTKMLKLIHAMAQKLGVSEEDDPEMAALLEAVRPETIAHEIETAFAAH